MDTFIISLSLNICLSFGSCGKGMGSEDEDDVFLGLEKDAGDDVIMNWAKVSLFFLSKFTNFSLLVIFLSAFCHFPILISVIGASKRFATDSLQLSCSATCPSRK